MLCCVALPRRAIVAVSTPRPKVDTVRAFGKGVLHLDPLCSDGAPAPIGKGAPAVRPFGPNPHRQWWYSIEPHGHGVRTLALSYEGPVVVSGGEPPVRSHFRCRFWPPQGGSAHVNGPGALNRRGSVRKPLPAGRVRFYGKGDPSVFGRLSVTVVTLPRSFAQLCLPVDGFEKTLPDAQHEAEQGEHRGHQGPPQSGKGHRSTGLRLVLSRN